MRDPNRIPEICAALEAAWMKHPDQRFGQFMSNFLGECVGKGKCSDIFFPEDGKWLQWLKDFEEKGYDF